MFCEKCGEKLDSKDKFCVGCGNSVNKEKELKNHTLNKENKWWVRLFRVIYILLYIPLPFTLYGVWTSNDVYTYYDYYSKKNISYGSFADAFWYSLLTFVIWVIVLRLIKISVKYIAIGQKPEWEKELKKIY